MNILFLTWKDIKHPFAGGAEKVIYEYARGLVKLGHKVTWFGYNFPGAKEKENIDGIEIIRKFTLNTAYFLFPSYYKKNLKGKYDIIIDEAGGLPFLSLKFEKDIPIIFFAHHIGDKEWDYNYPFPLNKIGKQLYYWLFKQYKNCKTIVVSNSTKQELIEKFLYKKENIKVIENACDIQPIKNIDFSKKENKILFLGRLMHIKRVEDAIKSFYYFLKSDNKFKDYMLDIIGNDQDKKYVNKLKELVKKLGIEKKVNFYGHIDRNQFDNIILKYKFILVPSIKEGFGLIVLEANSYGIPAIGYNVPGLKDSIKDGKNGYLVEDGNYKKIGEKLKDILSDVELYKRISISSLDYVKSLDNWDKKVKEFEKFILNIKR